MPYIFLCSCIKIRTKLLWITSWWIYHICHYNDVIMGAIASQITSLMIVYSTVYSGADQRKHQSSASLAFVRGIHRRSVNSAQMASNAENISIWWRHHVIAIFFYIHCMCHLFYRVRDRKSLTSALTVDPLYLQHHHSGGYPWQRVRLNWTLLHWTMTVVTSR